MAKKLVTKNNQMNKDQKDAKPAPTSTTTSKTTSKTTTQKPTPKKVTPQKPKVKVLDNLSILKSSPYLKQKNESKTPQKKPTLKDLFDRSLLSQKEEKLEIVMTGQYEQALDL
ncbi:MAG: hypothetical protein HWN80_20615, partial [Candidatus Lokiarchaeota archaeon]|nr:hypothetical protein [Candidatus Lokiarchaeota archaeon]